MALLEPKMDAFKAKHMITINADGDDCDAKQNSLWLARDIAAYAKSSAGAEDWDAIEGQSANDRPTSGWSPRTWTRSRGAVAGRQDRRRVQEGREAEEVIG